MNTEEALKAFDKVGGSAFPSEWTLPEGGSLTGPGMTLRDWFAGQAMRDLKNLHMNMNDYQIEQRAKEAYALADAMLRERQKP